MEEVLFSLPVEMKEDDDKLLAEAMSIRTSERLMPGMIQVKGIVMMEASHADFNIKSPYLVCWIIEINIAISGGKGVRSRLD